MNSFRGNRRFTVKEKISPEKYNRRLAVLLGLVTVGIIITLIFWGIPLLVNLADFLGKIQDSGKTVVSGDTLPPVPPQFSAPPEATNSAIVNLGGSSEPKSKVEIYLNGQLLAVTDADDKGEFQIEKVSLRPGENLVSALAIDEAGNKSDSSEEILIDFDNEPPLLEISQPQDGETVYEQKIEIKGMTEIGEIRLAINGYVVLVEKEGQFSHPLELTEGSNQIEIVVQDPAGNRTEKTLNVTYYR